MHTPVLLQQAMEGLQIRPGGLYIDATAGEGGHVREFLKRGAKVLAIDQDSEQINLLKAEFASEKNAIFEVQNFSAIEEIAKKHTFYPVDGVLFDLGISMRQINTSGRGFSWKQLDEPLDMRLDITQTVTAEEILNRKSEEELTKIFARGSEEIYSDSIAKDIVYTRRTRPLKKVEDLVKILTGDRKDSRSVSRIFQALRIEVNDEFSNLKKGLTGAVSIIQKPGGKIAVITFHSLEDRIVKLFARENGLTMTTKKPIRSQNGMRFERSAKLRIMEVNKL